MEPDFSGYATKAGLKCSDGRTIMPEAFQGMNGKRVPLVWRHSHDNPENVLGHAVLEAREDGIYAYAYLNDTPKAQSAKTLVQHGDVNSLSIYANQLIERGKSVFHGIIREVSLVLSGANPGALIDNVRIAHSDGETDVLDDEAIIYTGLSLEHEDQDDSDDSDDSDNDESDDDEDKTVKDVYDTLTDEQKEVVHYMIGAAVNGAVEHSADDDGEGDDSMSHKEGNKMARNVFEQNNGSDSKTVVLSHSDVKGIVSDAMKTGSLKDAVENYAIQHGIENIDVLFPDAKALTNTPDFDKRRTEWVASVLSGTKHSPFSRVKTLSVDLTHDEARARGYIKGSMKKEEFFKVSRRTTEPTTIYKKQKLDRDDVLDITDLDVVAWLKAEMRLMLDEELARAVLIGDGREVDDDDKIDEEKIRPIAKDESLFAATVYVPLSATGSSSQDIVDAVTSSRRLYKGSGTPAMYTTEAYLTQMLMAKDSLGRRLYRSVQELATELRVSTIIPVEPMEQEEGLIGVIVNLNDYTIGADKGGEVSMFDDFDIDYNQYKYLIETRASGGLTKIRSAVVLREAASDDELVTPERPTFVKSTGVITIPTQTGVTYQDEEGNDLNAGAQSPIPAGTTFRVVAVADDGYYLSNNVDSGWTFARPVA